MSGEIDTVLPFQLDALDVRGRIVHLGPSLDAILQRHGYPDAVARLLGEASALTVLIGTALKFDGRLTVQTKSDGPVSRLVVDFTAPDHYRACASFDADSVAAAVASGRARSEDLLGTGILALTVDMGESGQRYQGIVPLDGRSLEDAAHVYFNQSEQIPTRVRLAVGEVTTRRDGKGAPHSEWRAGGMLLQFLPTSSDRVRHRDAPPGDAPDDRPAPPADDDDAWTEARMLADTIEDIELVDPDVSAETLLLRLFHQRGVRVFDRQRLGEHCRCSRQAVENMLKSFNAEDRAHMVKDDRIVVTCEFCSTSYSFSAKDIIDPAG